jgi:hypothetical protein
MQTVTGLRKGRRKIKRQSGVHREITREIHFVQQTSGKNEYRCLFKDLIIIILTNILALESFISKQRAFINLEI